jgi:glucose/arabinose dehydrogenase
VYFTAGTFPIFDVVRRYQVSSNPDSANASSGLRMLRIQDPFGNHNGGQIAFGDDGYFYMAPGDGGSAGDPDNRAQDPAELLGKMLRVDLDNDDFPADPLTNYAIPPDNPFVASPDTLPEIWAFGLRNPYRWSFDRLNGDLYIGDVGQGAWEEIDYEPASSPGGLNFGWRIMEGNHCYEPPEDCDSTGLVLPVLEYDHLTGFSIIGGYVYRGSAIPNLYGHYFLADYITDLIWSFRINNGQAFELTDWGPVLNPNGEIQGITGFGEDADGELYFVLHGNGTNGQVRKIIPDSTSGPGPGPPVNAFQLSSARPNPFRESTQFTLQLPHPAHVKITLHDSSGRTVRKIENQFRSSGIHSYAWDGKDDEGKSVSSGIYYIRADAEGTQLTTRVTHLR